MDREVHKEFLRTPENRRLYQQEKLLVEATELLTEVMEEKKMSRAELARAIGKSKAFVTQVLRGNHNMTLRTLADLFGAMRREVRIQARPYRENQAEVADSDLSSTWLLPTVTPDAYSVFLPSPFASQTQAVSPPRMKLGAQKGQRPRAASEASSSSAPLAA